MNWFQSLAAKALRLGPAMAGFEASFGTDPERWSPEAYGRYVATSAPVHACVTIRARNLARLRLRVYKRAPNGERVEVTSGRLYDLMRSVNPHWTFRRLLRMTEMSLCLYGQAFWVLEGGSSTPTGRRTPPREIWWADPSKMRVVPDPDKWIAGFEYDGTSGRVAFPVEDVIWFRLDNPVDQYAGLSPLASARLAVDTAAGAMRSNRQIFDNGLQLAGIVGPADKTQTLTREQAETLSQMLERRFRGADKAHRMAVLTQPIAFTSLSLTPKDAEFLGLMKWSLREVATVYGVPPELIGDHEHATYSNVEQAAKALWTDTLIPQATMIADELTEQLVRLFPDEADEVEFDLSEIETLQEDRTEIIDQAVKLVGIGVPLNRVLQEIAPRFLPAAGDGYAWGDVAWMPATMVPVDGQQVAAPAPAPVTQAVRAIIDVAPTLPAIETRAVDFGSPRHVAVWRAFTVRTDKGEARMAAVLREYFRRQEQAVMARLTASKSAKTPEEAADNPFDLIDWAARLKAVGQPIISDVVDEAGKATLDDLSIAVSFDLLDPNVVNVIEGRSQRFARSVTETTWNDLRDTLSAGVQAGEGIPALQNRVARTMDEARTWRTEAIARTEVVGASNLGSLEGARQSGVVTTKTWLAALDDRTRDWHVAAHNQRVALDADFVVGGERGPSPHALPSAANVVNCRCTMTFEVD